ETLKKKYDQVCDQGPELNNSNTKKRPIKYVFIEHKECEKVAYDEEPESIKIKITNDECFVDKKIVIERGQITVLESKQTPEVVESHAEINKIPLYNVIIINSSDEEVNKNSFHDVIIIDSSDEGILPMT
ncbi:18406_t:CDS:2, partial [Racocetra fulgida]